MWSVRRISSTNDSAAIFFFSVLQLTAISTNIKERLDFSCAVFGPDGGLVANAPHIPVHLGAMQEAVQYQMRTVGKDLRDGDVILTNHPAAGGNKKIDEKTTNLLEKIFRKSFTGFNCHYTGKI